MTAVDTRGPGSSPGDVAGASNRPVVRGTGVGFPQPAFVVAPGGKVHVLRAHDSQRTACGRWVERAWLTALPGTVTAAWCCQGACRDTVMAAA